MKWLFLSLVALGAMLNIGGTHMIKILEHFDSLMQKKGGEREMNYVERNAREHRFEGC